MAEYKTVQCLQADKVLRSKKDVYLLLVSEECPFCKDVLDNFSALALDHPTIVMNTDACSDEIDQIVDWPATPMIVHFKDGVEVRRGVGVEGIMQFGPDENIDPIGDLKREMEAKNAPKPGWGEGEEDDSV